MSPSPATDPAALTTAPTTAPTGASAVAESLASNDGGQWPTETEIYILPDGRVVVADLPAELDGLADALGAVEPGEIAPDAQSDTPL